MFGSLGDRAIRVLLIAALIASTVLAVAAPAPAQDLEPRAYANTPVGLNFLIAGYAYTTGGIATDPALPIADAELTLHTGVLAYARSLDFFGRSGKVDVVVPYSGLSGSALVMGQEIEREITGFHDPRFRLSVNLYGAPALSFEEFAAYQQDLIIGISLAVTTPLGQYDSDKAVNLGTNRWSVKPEVGISKALGPVTLELAAGATVYTDNDDFLGRTREQDPLYSFQGNVIYQFPRGIWGAVTATYLTGGRTTVDGRRNDDRQDNLRVGGTISVPLSRYQSVKVYGATGASTRVGGEFDVVGILWQYRWGTGF
jgi:Putative MetA-pathway of phenol degradation